jgi:cytochrome d ubiquinol oxidase subunit II
MTTKRPARRGARLAAGLAVTAVIWGWGAGQYPYVLDPQLTVDAAAAPSATLRALLATLLVGSVILVPSLVYLYTLFQRAPEAAADHGRST